MQIHGITNERCDKGEDAIEALNKLYKAVESTVDNGGKILGHNIAFDIKAVMLTMSAHGMQPIEINNTFCLMNNSTKHSPLVNKAGNRKAFRNDELYEHLYKSKPKWARLHSAYDDVCVTALNYIGGLNKNWW